MREILFRGKRTDNGEWVCGNLIIDHDLEKYYICGFKYFTADYALQREEFNYEVDPETVGQYTGFTDKNGVKIFEGDIVRERGGESYQGYYEIDNVLIVEIPDTLVNFVIGCDCEYKIIGNIHDNPELLEGVKENE